MFVARKNLNEQLQMKNFNFLFKKANTFTSDLNVIKIKSISKPIYYLGFLMVLKSIKSRKSMMLLSRFFVFKPCRHLLVPK